MANQNSKVFNIDLKGELLTTLNKNDIKQFTGFNQRNSPILNDGLKHFLRNRSSSIRDNNGNIYELKNNALYKNNEFVKNIASGLPFVKVEEISIDYEGLSNVEYTIPYVSDDKEFKCIQTTSALYIYEKEGTSYILKNTFSKSYTSLNSLDCLVFYNILNTDIDVVVIYDGEIIHKVFTASESISDTGLNFTVWEDTNNDPYFLFRMIKKNYELLDVDPADTSTVPFYYFDLTNGATSGSGVIDNRKFFDRNNYIVNTIPNINNYLYWEITTGVFTGKIYRNWIEEKGDVLCSFFNGVITEGAYNIHYIKFPLMQDITPNITFDGEPGPYAGSMYAYYSAIMVNLEVQNTKVLILNNEIKYTNTYKYQSVLKTVKAEENVTFSEYTQILSNSENFNTWFNSHITSQSTSKKSEISYFSNYYKGSGEFILGGGCTTGVDGKADFKESFTLDMGGEFKLVYNNNYFANYSWCGKIIENWLSIDDTYSRPIWCDNVLYYQKRGKKTWYKAYEQNNIGYVTFLLNRYILLCTKLEPGDVYNMYDTQNNTWYDYACDWDNRFLIGSKSDIDYTSVTLTNNNYSHYSFSCEEGTGEDLQNNSPVSSANFQPIIYNQILPFIWNTTNYQIQDVIKWVTLGINENYPHSVEVYLSTTLNSNPEVATPYFSCIWDNNSMSIPSNLVGKIFPLNDGNIVLNTPLKIYFETTAFNNIYVYQDETYYQLMTLNSEVLFLYAYGTGISNISYLFCLQGNTYVIQNNIINSCVIQDNVISNVTALISCEGLKYLGATLDVAYFYSEANKNILVFTGDRRLNILTEFNGISRVYKSGYSVPFSTFFILTNIGLICISDKGYIYILDEDVYTDFVLYTTGINLLSDTWDFYSIYNEGDRVKIKAQTSFYGFGNNQVTIIDTWYVRLYADEAFNGSIKFRVTSLTNKGTESEETEFLITSDMFDKVTNSYYLRYQPKLQRGVGLSLSIESDYDIIELSCSATADTTVQLSKPFSKQNVINGGKI